MSDELSRELRRRIRNHGLNNTNAHYIFNEDLRLWAERAEALEQRVKELETEGCGQCEACEDFFPLSLLSMTDDGVFLCRDDWADLLVETETLEEA